MSTVRVYGGKHLIILSARSLLTKDAVKRLVFFVASRYDINKTLTSPGSS